MFQLSIELYDTKDKKVVWSDRWQEKWDNLPSIKANLSDGLLKALDTKSKVEQKADTINPEAYEFYLKGKYIINKRFGKENMELARQLLYKSLDLDNNIWEAKNLIAASYSVIGDHTSGLRIWKSNLKEAQSIENKLWIAGTLSNIGAEYMRLGDLDSAMDYQKKSIKAFNQLTYIPLRGIGWPLKFIGEIYQRKGNFDKAINYYNQQLEENTKVQNFEGEVSAYKRLGVVYIIAGNYNKALKYLFKLLYISKDTVHYDDGMVRIGSIYSKLGDYTNAIKYLKKTIKNYIVDERISPAIRTASIHLGLSYKQLGKKYDKKVINAVELVEIDEEKHQKIGYDNNYHLYLLLEDKTYLESAYKQIQENASAMDEKLSKKFLSYPIPKAIVEAWEKVK